MKKVIATFLLLSFFALAGVGFAEAISPIESCNLVREVQYDGDTYSGTVDIDEGDGVGAVVCMINTVNRAAQVLFYIMMGLVVGLVVVGGFFILTGGQKEDNIAKGKKYITYAIVGVFIAVFAYAVPPLLGFIMG